MDYELPSAVSAQPTCVRGKTDGKKGDGYKSDEAPLPRHWCGSNLHRDARQLQRPNLDCGQDRESAFAAICRWSSVRQKNRRQRAALFPPLPIVPESSKNFSLDQCFYTNRFADAASDIFGFLLG